MAFILDDILLAPCKAITWIGRTLYDQAEAQLTDESVIRERLMDLQNQLDLEQIDEQQFIEQEGALMRRLDAIHKYKENRDKA